MVEVVHGSDQRDGLPGFFGGLLDARVSKISDEMMIAAPTAISDTVEDAQLNAGFIAPSGFDPRVAPAVAAAIGATVTPGR